MQIDGTASGSRWVGAPPTGLQIAAILIVANIASLMPSLLPILLAGLMQEHRLTASQLGQAAMTELLVMGVVSGLAGAFLPPRRLRVIGLLAGAFLCAANLATLSLSGYAILAARGLSGVGCGLFLWILVCMLVRSHNASRWIGIYLLLQASAALALSSAFSTFLVPRFGINGSFATLAGVGVATALISALLPRAFEPLEHSAHGGGPPPLSGVLALIMAFFYLSGVLAIWVYVGAMSRQTGNGAGTTDFAFTLAFAMQIVGAGTASVLAERVPLTPIVWIGGLLSMGAAGLIVGGASGHLFIACVAVFAGLWMFMLSYQIPFVVDADPTRKAAMLAGSIQSLGSAAGPAIASLAVQGTDVRGALWAGIAMLGFAIMAALAARVAARPRYVPAGGVL